MNIRFEYLYRDAGNYKRWGEIVFSNRRDSPAEHISSMASKVLIDQAYFIASIAAVPDLHFDSHIEEIDHGWHEVYSFNATDAVPSDGRDRDIEEFIEFLRMASEVDGPTDGEN